MYSSMTDGVLQSLRTVLGDEVVLDEGTVQIVHKPEMPLYAAPEATDFPMLALQVVDEKPGGFPEIESVRVLSVAVTVAIGFVARLDDMLSVGLSSSVEYSRKVCGALDTTIHGTPDLGNSSMLAAEWLGSMPFEDDEADLRGRGLVAHVTLWEFTFGADR